MKEEGITIGIDLGTTNSAYAYIENGKPEMGLNTESSVTTPSVVAIDGDNTLVGNVARNQAIQNPDKTVRSVKRKMGDKEPVMVDGEDYQPEEISAEILKKIKNDAEDYTGEKVTGAVITVPAYFNDKQRNATKNAAEIAGINVEKIINEPTAASMAYGIDKSEGEKNVLVYDLGGGTFDVSILEISMGIYEVLSTSGINNLGGDDWTQKIIDYIVKDFKDEHNIDLTNYPEKMERIWEASEEAKFDLSYNEETEVSLPFIYEDDGDIYDIEKKISRRQFEEKTSRLINNTIKSTKKAIKESDLELDEIDDLLLVGGATRMPQVENNLKKHFGINPKQDVNPDEAVAIGAGIQAGISSGKDINDSQIEDMVLLDVTPLSLGVEVKGGLFEPIIERNTKIPTKSTKTFTTVLNNQNVVDIKVYQGERKVADKNELLDNFKLKNIPEAKAGQPEIKVSFSIDENGIVNVEAEETETGQKEEVTIEGSVGLSDEEMEEMKADADKHTGEDQKYKEKVRTKNQANVEVKKAKDFLRNKSRYISEDKVKAIQNKIETIEEKLESDEFETEEIQELVSNLVLEIEESKRQIQK